MSDQLVKIRFILEADGFSLGQEIETTLGVADAYVNHRKAAVYVEDMKTRRQDKLIRSGGKAHTKSE